jgi:hypothetical protein
VDEEAEARFAPPLHALLVRRLELVQHRSRVGPKPGGQRRFGRGRCRIVVARLRTVGAGHAADGDGNDESDPISHGA